MPHPLAICLEDLDAGSPGERYLRCVALPGRQPGLRVDRAGVVLWRSDEAVACELWVSQDERLILYRPAGGAPVTVRRAGRALAVPFGKPVVLIDQDEVDAGMRRLKVHVHGVATTVAEPALLPVPEKAARSGLRSAAAAVALGAALGGAALFQVRCHPPEVSPNPPRPEDRDAGAPPPDDAGAQQDIEVRVVPPEAPPDYESPPPPPPPPEPIEVRETPPIAPFPDSVPGEKPGGQPKPE